MGFLTWRKKIWPTHVVGEDREIWEPGLAKGETSSGVTAAARLDASTEALIGVDYPHHDLHEGEFYTYQDVVALSNGASQDYIITQPDTDKHGHLGFQVEFNDGEGEMELFRSTDRNGTTLQSVYNSNDNFPDAAGVTIHKGQTGGTTDGVRVNWHVAGSRRVSGGTAGSISERVLGRNIKYLLRVTNNISTVNTVNVDMGWYEHTPRNI